MLCHAVWLRVSSRYDRVAIGHRVRFVRFIELVSVIFARLVLLRVN